MKTQISLTISKNHSNAEKKDKFSWCRSKESAKKAEVYNFTQIFKSG